jgi:hypothetical protein
MSQIVIAVEKAILREFRAECIRRETTPTRELARLMEEQLHEWANTETTRKERPCTTPSTTQPSR